MTIKQDTFFKVIDSLKNQYDKDVERAKLLSDIYGSDIDPVDNSLLTDSIFSLLLLHLSDQQVLEVSFFCYDQNFGRNVNIGNEDLWNTLINLIEVIDPITLTLNKKP